jgi:HPt (histidine-containing phosphotransfer) domain-containing protein
MDDFLTKPVVTERLEGALRNHLRNHQGDRTAPAARPAAPPATVALDPSRIRELESMGGRAAELVDRAITNFVAGMDDNLSQLRRAATSGDAEQLRALAHRVRGSALNLGALRLAELGFELEHLDDHDFADRADDVLEAFEKAADQAAAALEEYRAGQVVS